MKHSLLLPDLFLIALFPNCLHKTMNFGRMAAAVVALRCEGQTWRVVNLIQSSTLSLAVPIIDTAAPLWGSLCFPDECLAHNTSRGCCCHISCPMYYITALIHILLLSILIFMARVEQSFRFFVLYMRAYHFRLRAFPLHCSTKGAGNLDEERKYINIFSLRSFLRLSLRLANRNISGKLLLLLCLCAAVVIQSKKSIRLK